MLKRLYFIFSVAMLLCSCEVDVPMNNSENENELTVFSVVAAGQQIKLHLSHNLPIAQGKNFYYLDWYDFQRETAEYYPQELMIKDATVKLTVNGKEEHYMTFSEDDLCFVCDYSAQPGDHLTLDVKSGDYKPVHATTTVPAEPRELKDLQYEAFYDQAATMADRLSALSYYTHDHDAYGADTLMTISFKFQDPAKEVNYYRLKVRSTGKYKCYSLSTGFTGEVAYTACDVFTSTDPLFYDALLTKPYASWAAYFSNVFDDHLIDGKEYSITVNSRKRLDYETSTIIELQSISPELYHFLKAMQLYRIFVDEAFSSPVSIDGNIENGWGVFGSLSTNTYIIYR